MVPRPDARVKSRAATQPARAGSAVPLQSPSPAHSTAKVYGPVSFGFVCASIMFARRGALFDYFVSTHQDRWGNGQAERLGGLQVDAKLELGRLLNRKISRF